MPEVMFNLTVDGKTWSRPAQVFSVKSASMLCTYAERLFELMGLPGKATVTEMAEPFDADADFADEHGGYDNTEGDPR